MSKTKRDKNALHEGYTHYFSKLHQVWKPLLHTDNVKKLKQYGYQLR